MLQFSKRVGVSLENKIFGYPPGGLEEEKEEEENGPRRTKKSK